VPVTFRKGSRTGKANRSHGGGQGALINGKGSADAGEPIAEALRLLDLFASVGAEAFDITHTNLQQEKRGFRPAQSLAQARQSMPYLVPSAARRQNNLIVRPRAGADVTLVQLDDLAPDALAHIAPAAFLILRTSPRGQQAWVAVTNAPRGFAARLKEGTGADKEASGATRVAGTANFKPAYAPNFPRIRSTPLSPGSASLRRPSTRWGWSRRPGRFRRRRHPPCVLRRSTDPQMAQLRALPRRGADRPRR
jgi:hypothetical protein